MWDGHTGIDGSEAIDAGHDSDWGIGELRIDPEVKL